jgi:ribosomal protein S18 acetylase RimI-like enzyme
MASGFSRDELKQIAHLHASCIDQGFLATLGEPFLALLYEAIDSDSRSVLLVEKQGADIVGFVSSSFGMSSIYRRLIRSAPRLAWVLLPVVLKPRKLLKILELVRHSRRSAESALGPTAELLSIAVTPSARGQGLAQNLYARLCEHYHAVGVAEFQIVVGQALQPARKFYQKMGARVAGQRVVHVGKQSVVYVQRVDKYTR